MEVLINSHRYFINIMYTTYIENIKYIKCLILTFGVNIIGIR